MSIKVEVLTENHGFFILGSEFNDNQNFFILDLDIINFILIVSITKTKVLLAAINLESFYHLPSSFNCDFFHK